MQTLKYIELILIFCTTTSIGILIANKYKKRVEELKEIKNALNMVETKMKYTYEPIADIFKQVSESLNENIANIFKKATNNMKETSAGEAWNDALDSVNTNLKKEDIQILKNLNKLLGKTSIEGQITEIELTNEFLDTQIYKAQKEQEKNEKMYKNLGIIAGLTLIIILI